MPSTAHAEHRQAFIGEGDLPYGGDLQAAMRAQAKPVWLGDLRVLYGANFEKTKHTILGEQVHRY